MTNSISVLSPYTQQSVAGLAQPPVTAADLPGEFDAGLSPDALMAYCQSRLDSIDGQVQASFDGQQKSTSEIGQIDQAVALLKTYASNGTTDAQTCTELETKLGAIVTAIKNTDPNCAALPSLTQTYNNMVWSGTGGGANGPQFIDGDKYPPQHVGDKPDNDLDSDEIQSYVESLTDAAATLNSGSELEMINLQSLMSQRDTAISLTTNLVQSLGDQESKIAGNIGH